MITRRHDNQAPVAVGVGPGAGFVGVADGIERVIAEIDAAGVKLILQSCEALDLFPANFAIDARDQQTLSPAFRQQPGAGLNAGFAACQHDNAVSFRDIVPVIAHDDGCKKHKSKSQRRCGQRNQINNSARNGLHSGQAFLPKTDVTRI